MSQDQIVITKTPLRISFIGGGTDMPYFYNRFGGSTISCAINKYIYVTVKFHNNYQEKYRINYSQTENTNHIKKIKNLRIRLVIEKLKIQKPLYINTFADLPANSGLGSSSSFTVGLIKALGKLNNQSFTTNQIAEMAYEIEAKITRNSLGKQDHYISAYGSFHHIKYLKNEILLSPIDLKKNNFHNFFESIFLIWTGKNRSASRVLQDQKKNINENLNNLKKIKNLSIDFKNELIKKKISIKKLGGIINESWFLKKHFSKLISNNKIDNIYKKIVEKGAYGGKLLGAGNGGFLLILCNKNKKSFFKNLFKKNNYKYFEVLLDKSGSVFL